MSLTDRREELLEALGRGEVPACDREELVALVDQVLRDKQARSEAMAARNRERAASTRRGIEQAIGALPRIDAGRLGSVDITLNRIATRGPEAFDLTAVPDPRTVRSVLRAMHDVPVSACADGSQSSVHASSTSMST